MNVEEILEQYLNSIISYPFQKKDKEYILDYITNLQQIEQDHQRINGELREELEDYKSRCEKISNLILEKVRDTALYGEADLSLETLLNIANGGDKNVK